MDDNETGLPTVKSQEQLDAECGKILSDAIWQKRLGMDADTTTLCWNCSKSYEIAVLRCLRCGATNANVDPDKAAEEMVRTNEE